LARSAAETVWALIRASTPLVRVQAHTVQSSFQGLSISVVIRQIVAADIRIAFSSTEPQEDQPSTGL
jgi:hypothetical protein